jgi:DNA helicase HerA-like ATPase
MKIGKIISVEYDKFRVRLFHSTKTSTISIDGQVYYFGNIGSYLKTYNAIGDAIICEVVAVVDYSIDSKVYSSFNLDSSRELVIKPIGIIKTNNEFSMGVGIFPSLYNDVDIVTVDDLNKILSPSLKKENALEGIHKTITIGQSKSLINYQISLDINQLFNIHTAVLGNSGSGKSNTIAHILQEVYRKHDNYAIGSKTILFDVNGEYPCAFVNAKLDKEIQPVFYKPNISDNVCMENEVSYKKFILPYYLMNLDEWLAFLMASDRTQKPFWDKVLQECFKFYKIFNHKNNDNSKYINYFKWKILRILKLVLSQVDSDTVRITAARSIILRCKDIIKSIDPDNNNLKSFLEESESKCTISYGDNKQCLENHLSDSSESIKEDDALEIDSIKLKSGDYYDYRFLQTAVEITLLEEEARGNTRIREFTSTMLSRLENFLNNPECNFMRDFEQKFSDKEDYLEKMFSICENNKNQLITIDTSEVGPDILELMTSVVTRMIFDIRKSKQGDDRRKHPIHLILDEAHRYIKKDAVYILRENIFEKIAREGRKYSLYLIISSQRPSELSSTVLSQCGNYIIHRIQNEVDMKYIYSVLPYFSDSYISRIKQSVPGEALIFGNCVPMPLQVKVTQANPDPNSKNCNIREEWFTISKEFNVVNNGNEQ